MIVKQLARRRLLVVSELATIMAATTAEDLALRCITVLTLIYFRKFK